MNPEVKRLIDGIQKMRLDNLKNRKLILYWNEPSQDWIITCSVCGGIIYPQIKDKEQFFLNRCECLSEVLIR